MRKKIVYLDYAASTPLDPKVLKAMLPYLKGEFGNPSSVHALGQKARAAVERAREQAASFLACSASEIVFTSGATEANNLAVQGVARAKRKGEKVHVITSAIEHESALAPVQELEKQGVIEATYLSVGKEGVVNPEDVEKAIKNNTVLVSVQYANSEVGTVQPVAQIGRIAKKAGVLFHTDAVQAANYLECGVAKLNVDLLTLSSHKVYGPKGAGALYARKGTPLSPLLLGGGQEGDLRSGTENVAAVVGMGEALAELLSPKRAVQQVSLRQLRDRLVKEVLRSVPGASLSGSRDQRLANNAHFLIEGVQGKDAVQLLDRKGVAVSTGSACSERSQEPSHVLLAMGYSRQEALSAVRFTLGKGNKKEDVEKAVRVLRQAVEQLRKGK